MEHVLERWKPADPSAGDGYFLSDKSAALREACARLNVSLTAAPIHGDRWKSIGAPVIAADGTQSWIKISGRQDQLPDRLRNNEIEAGNLAGIPKPQVMAHFDWSSDGVRWRALQMTLAPSPVIETTPWSGARAHAVTDDWISRFQSIVGTLSGLPCDRHLVTPGELTEMIRRCFGDGIPTAADEWGTAFGEAHWGNVTAPDLLLLDWERWGLAPRGYDAALMIGFSAADTSLTERLQAAFEEDLQTPSGRVAQLYACGELLIWIDSDLIHPGLRKPVLRLAEKTIYESRGSVFGPRTPTRATRLAT